MPKLQPSRRTLLAAAMALPVLSAMSRTAQAEVILENIKLFVPAAPGGGWDATARLMEKVLRETGLVTNIQVENVAGAGGTVALPRFINAMRGRADTLMVSGLTQLSSATVNKSPVTLAQTVPIARLSGETHVLVVPADSPIKTTAEFVAAFRENPKAISVAGGSAGGTDHILLAMMAGKLGISPSSLSYVAFNSGGPAVTAIIGNQVKAGISNWSEFAPHVQTGRMRALGLSSDERLPGVDVPTLKERGVDAVLYNWRSVFAPPRISPQETEKLEKLVEAMVRSKTWETEAAQRGWLPLYMPREEFTAFLRTESETIEASLKQIGLAG
jgi:putative tricarboxylic transport membrane protein